MNRSRRGQMRSPFTQANLSSSSLEGMEKPVRSFKSFIKTVPPNPSPPRHNNKPLPPTPSPSKATTSTPSPPSSRSSPASQARTPSVTSWKAPAEWFNSSIHKQDTPQASPIPSSRQYSPLLPEPSPDLADKYMEIRAVQGDLTPSQQSQLMPIYERTNLELGPPRSPPRSPLPTPPKSSSKTPEKETPRSYPANTLAIETGSDAILDHNVTQKAPRVASPAHSTTSRTSNASTKEKAFASLGISSPIEQSMILENGLYQSYPSQDFDDGRLDRQYLRGRKIRALNKGSPLAGNSWEDPDMDERTRQLSFSQDYHDLLADQYQEMSVRSEEVPRIAPTNTNSSHLNGSGRAQRIPGGRELVPQPLSWRKSSSGPSSRGASQTRNETSTLSTEASSHAKTKRISNKIAAWVPHRLSVGPKRTVSKHGESAALGQHSLFQSEASSQNRIPESKVDEVLANDFRFSKFFSPSKPIRFGKKTTNRDTNEMEGSNSTVPQLPPLPIPQTATPLLLLPGGLAVVRTPAIGPRSEEASIVDRSSVGDAPPSVSLPGSGGTSDLTNSPTSNPSEHRSSYNSQQSNTARPAVRNKFRTSLGSSHSQQSSGSSHPLSQELSQIPNLKTPLTSKSWRRFSGGSDMAWRKPGLVEKAREARRRHNKEVRQERLKRSIRVLGPTDPGVAAGYVKREGRQGEVDDNGRMPGYMVSGPI